MESLSQNSTTVPLQESTAPSNRLVPNQDLFPFIRDQHLPYVAPVAVYWIVSLAFHFIDTRGLFPKYKIHTSAELLKTNEASRFDVIKYAIIQQVAQVLIGFALSDETEYVQTHSYVIFAWASFFRQVFSGSRALLGIDVVLNAGTKGNASFRQWEWALAESMYWTVVPIFQFAVALLLADTWQYFTHRLLHSNKFLYKHIHSMHHEIRVNYAYGAFYNHPLETIPIDGIGFPICLGIAQLSVRQSTLFAIIWTVKNVMDHCGYAFPFDPCNLICPQSQYFHDLHHQRWGIKHNFSNYTPLWDYLLGTFWDANDAKAQDRYAKQKERVESLSSSATKSE